VNVVTAHDPEGEGRILRGPAEGHKLSKLAVNYLENGGTAGKSCASCRYHSGGSCRLVEGTILPGGLSSLYEPVVRAVPGMLNYYHDLTATGSELTPVLELPVPLGLPVGADPQAFKDSGGEAQTPEWIPYLPKPGTFTHPKYGTVKIDEKRNANFVSQFKAGVYQDRLPIDAEHQTTVSGALGWITDLRLNKDGSVDAKASWTDRGKVMLANDRLPYFSPAFFDKWVDPTDGKVHEDVAIGGALTTRPFFKPKSGLRAVRPLVASDDHMYIAVSAVDNPDMLRFSEAQFAVLEQEEKGDLVTVPAAAPNTAAAAATQTPPAPAATVEIKSDQVIISKAEHEELINLRAAQAKTASEIDPQIAALKLTTETQATALKTASEQLAAMQFRERQRDFLDIINGADGRAKWQGEAEKHLQMMEILFNASNEGMESQTFKDYVEMNTATAEQAKDFQKFRDVGSNSAMKVVSGSPTGKIQAAAKVFSDADPKLSAGDAMIRALEADPSLYNEYQEWHRENGKGS
jgi:phage I-like protein